MKIKEELQYYKKILLIAIPVMTQNFISNFAQLIDNLMVGTLGAESIAGVGAANAIFNVIFMLMLGISEGISIFIAQFHGSKKKEKQQDAFIFGVAGTFILALCAFIFVQLYATELISFFTKDTLPLSVGIKYIKIASYSYIFFGVSVAISASFRSIGKPKYPMYAGIVAISTNTLLNYVLINGLGPIPALGVEGAAIATIISRVIEIITLIYILKVINPSFWPNIKKLFSFDFSFGKSIMIKTIPLTFNEFMWGSAMATLMALYGKATYNDLVAVQIANTIANLFFVLMGGFAVAVSVSVGHELGKNNLKEAKNNAIKLLRLSLIVGLLAGSFYLMIGKIIPQFYNVDDSIKVITTSIMNVQAFFFTIYIVTATCFFLLRAGGDTKSVLILDAIFMWSIVIPIAIFLAYKTNYSIVEKFLLIQSTDILKMSLGLYFIKRGKWIKNITC